MSPYERLCKISHIPIPQNFSSLKLLFQLLQKFNIQQQQQQQQHLDMPTLEKSLNKSKDWGKTILYSPVSECQEFFLNI